MNEMLSHGRCNLDWLLQPASAVPCFNRRLLCHTHLAIARTMVQSGSAQHARRRSINQTMAESVTRKHASTLGLKYTCTTHSFLHPAGLLVVLSAACISQPPATAAALCSWTAAPAHTGKGAHNLSSGVVLLEAVCKHLQRDVRARLWSHLLQHRRPAHLEQQLAGVRQLQAGHVVRGLGGWAHRVAPCPVPVPQQPAVLAHVHLRTHRCRIGHSRMQRSCRVLACIPHTAMSARQ